MCGKAREDDIGNVLSGVCVGVSDVCARASSVAERLLASSNPSRDAGRPHTMFSAVLPPPFPPLLPPLQPDHAVLCLCLCLCLCRVRAE